MRQIRLVVEVVEEDVGCFIVTSQVFGSKVVIKEDLTGLLEPP